MRTASKTTLALRGLVVSVVLVIAAAAIVTNSAGMFAGSTTITCLLPVSAGPVAPDTPVLYRGVRVGTVAEVRADSDGATVTVAMRDGMLARIPGGVRARLLPRTVFGDEYIGLSVPDESRAERELRPGAVVEANTSTRTVRLYTAYNQLYELISAMHPAEIQAALDTLSDVLRGRGTEIGRMIDKAARLGGEVRPMLDGLGADLRAVAELARGLAAASPDMLAALKDAIELSETVVDERDTIHALLTSGTALADQTQRSLLTNGERVIELVHTADGVAEIFTRHPNAIEASLDAVGLFLDKAIRAFSTGQFKINAALSLDNPYPYTAKDCPSYPGEAGPNCDDPTPEQRSTAESARRPPGGTAGPVGSPAEDAKLRELGSSLANDSGLSKPDGDEPVKPNVDLLGILLGPMVRGEQVRVP